jgi:Kef-type K+ transport system membrane component KefB
MRISQHEITAVLIQLGIMLLAGRLLSELARKVKQPAVVGEILAGILLGPTLLGYFQPELFEKIFHVGQSPLVLDGFVQVAVVLLLFIAGLEVDLHVVWQQGKQALFTSFFGLVIPFAFGFGLPYLLKSYFIAADDHTRLAQALFMGISMAITALPVIVRILMDINMFKTKMGFLRP